MKSNYVFAYLQQLLDKPNLSVIILYGIIKLSFLKPLKNTIIRLEWNINQWNEICLTIFIGELSYAC